MSKLDTHTFAYLDVETTGLSPWFGDRICEIAVIRCEGARIIGEFHSLVNPGRPLSPAAARVNGLKDSDLKDAPRFSEVAASITLLIKDAVIVCHNVPFDLGFLSSELGRINHIMPAVLTLDTLRIAREYFNFASNSLQSIAQQLGAGSVRAHRALDDALTTRSLLQIFSGQLSAVEIEQLIEEYHPPQTLPQVHSLPPKLDEAFQSKKRLHLHYVDRKGAASERWVTPIQVLAMNDYLYLVAYCHLRESERQFRLDRIESMDLES